MRFSTWTAPDRSIRRIYINNIGDDFQAFYIEATASGIADFHKAHSETDSTLELADVVPIIRQVLFERFGFEPRGPLLFENLWSEIDEYMCRTRRSSWNAPK